MACSLAEEENNGERGGGLRHAIVKHDVDRDGQVASR
jgi:hypothetical protein